MVFEAEALNNLGITLHLSGSPHQSIECHNQALALVRNVDDYEYARAHEGLAQSHYELTNIYSARAHWQHALNLHTKLGTPQAHHIAIQLHTLTTQGSQLN